MKKPINLVAFDLRRELFELCNRFKAAQLAAGSIETDAGFDAEQQLDEAACKLASVYDDLGRVELFVDAARDPKDQTYAIG